jgi:HlyD family secretion protein
MKRRLNWKHWMIILAGVLIVVVVLAKSFGKKQGVEVEVEAVGRRTIVSKVSESGTIQPDLDVPVGPDVSGEIVDIFVKEGDFVKRGQLLFTIRPDNLQAALEQASASYSSSRADYESAKATLAQSAANLKQDSITLARNKVLRDQGAVSAQDFETARLNYEVRKEQLEASRQAVNAAYYRSISSNATVKQAREQLYRTSVFASMDGTVTKVNAKKGERVVGFGQMSGTEVLRLADLTRMEVKVEINENDIVNLALGDTATIEVDAYAGKLFKGIVTDIAYASSTTATAAATTTDQITNYPVQILIQASSYQELMKDRAKYQSPFRPGMTALVSVYTDKVDGVIAIPIQAVTIERADMQQGAAKGPAGKKDAEKPAATNEPKAAPGSSQPQEVVFVVGANGIAEMRKVTTGVADDQFIEIKGGLTDSLRVVVGPYSSVSKLLKDGSQVEEKKTSTTGRPKKDAKPAN